MFTAYRNLWFWVVVILVVPALWALWIHYPLQMGGLHILVGIVSITVSVVYHSGYIDDHLIGDMDDGAFKTNIRWTFWVMFISFLIVSLIMTVFGIHMVFEGGIPIQFV